MQDQILPLTARTIFRFTCHAGVSCFNKCCRDLQQFLTPYDILRLRKHLDISSAEFLKAFTTRHTGSQSGLPVITITSLSRGDACPFVSATGCTVYENRPTSCRMYPLARAITRNRDTGETEEHFALLQEAHCRGCEGTTEWTPPKWMTNQGLHIYNQMNDLMLEIIRLKNRFKPGPLSLMETHLFENTLYDPDAFRSQIENWQRTGKTISTDALTDTAMSNDIDLLRLGYRFVKQEMFDIKM